MPEIQAHRKLVKSPPELWAELSDPETLAQHLGDFGEIRVTRREPETTVAWEGEEICGTVTIVPAGWCGMPSSSHWRTASARSRGQYGSAALIWWVTGPWK